MYFQNINQALLGRFLGQTDTLASSSGCINDNFETFALTNPKDRHRHKWVIETSLRNGPEASAILKLSIPFNLNSVSTGDRSSFPILQVDTG